jgi:hypothetical protein
MRFAAPRRDRVVPRRPAGDLLTDLGGHGAEDGQVAALLAGRGRVVGVADGEGNGVQPAGAVAELVPGELGTHVGERGAVLRRGGLQRAVQGVDAVVERLMVGA